MISFSTCAKLEAWDFKKLIIIINILYNKILTWVWGFMDKIANFSRLYCLIIPWRDLIMITKKTKPSIEINDQKASESCEWIAHVCYSFTKNEVQVPTS